jgi:GntR family transcriptional regulator, transcriptional repressor for pyruvate dehydrogenase complex
MFKPLKNKRFSDQVAEKIQNKIIEDNLSIDSGLPSEKEMALEFQVSRSVIREALRILEITGFVRIKKGPTGGIFVANGYHEPIKRSINNLISSGDVTIDHLFDARLLIEPYIATEAAKNAGEKDLRKIKALFEDANAHHDDALRLKKSNLEFHILLARASGNPVLALMLESVIELLIERSLDLLDLSLERKFIEIHQNIFNVLEQRNASEVSRLIREDIGFVRASLKTFQKHEKVVSA